MNLTCQAKKLVVAITLGLTALTPTLAQNMVSIKGSSVNMRASPSTQADVLWELEKGYPLKVLKRQGRWLQVQDFENDRGWVARSLTGNTPHHIVTAKVANLRKGPGLNHAVVGRAESMELLRTIDKKSSWVNVERATGETGWISKKLLWGW